MAKSNAEILEAHKRTIEVFTGQQCTIILADKNEEILKLVSLTEILTACEKYNDESFSIVSSNRKRLLVNLRKIFCLLADRCGHSSVKIGRFLSKKDHTSILYSIKTGMALLQADKEFKNLHDTILNDLVNYKCT